MKALPCANESHRWDFNVPLPIGFGITDLMRLLVVSLYDGMNVIRCPLWHNNTKSNAHIVDAEHLFRFNIS
jgi:hypothetical protein